MAFKKSSFAKRGFLRNPFLAPDSTIVFLYFCFFGEGGFYGSIDRCHLSNGEFDQPLPFYLHFLHYTTTHPIFIFFLQLYKKYNYTKTFRSYYEFLRM